MFDFTPQTEPEVVTDLRAARALMEPGYVRFARRDETVDGVRFCIGGAIQAAIKGDELSWQASPRFRFAADAINEAIDRHGFDAEKAVKDVGGIFSQYQHSYRFAWFNNAPTTSHADILKVFDDAITATLNDGVGGPQPARETCHA